MDGMTEISMDGKEAGADGVEREGGGEGMIRFLLIH